MRAPKVKDQAADRRAGGASDADDALERSKKGPEMLSAPLSKLPRPRVSWSEGGLLSMG